MTPEGELATTYHPQELGSTLTHPLITTDYAESLLEFITPVSSEVETTLAQLRDLHRVTYQAIGEELLWPLSMPCYLNELADIRLAQYGSSHVGQMKTTYREGLTHRYGAVMQTIAGVHYNFSVPDEMWPLLAEQDGRVNTGKYRSERYFGLIRNFKRLAWVVPYLFGASPVICGSFLRKSDTDLQLEDFPGGMKWRPYATCLRMSDLGYTNQEQAELRITYNSLDDYVQGLRRAVSTPSERFARIGVKVADHYRQLNDNLLQIENEFYSTIRPKRTARDGETPTQALERGGVEYIEIRAVDVNPFSAQGISAEQMRLLDLILLHCLFTESPELSWEHQELADQNVNRVVLAGRRPGLTLTDATGTEQPLTELLAELFAELAPLAELLDEAEGGTHYQQMLRAYEPQVTDPAETLSARLVDAYAEAHEQGENLGMRLAQAYRDELMNSGYEYYDPAELRFMAEQSLTQQAEVEAADEGSFTEFLTEYFANAQVNGETQQEF